MNELANEAAQAINKEIRIKPLPPDDLKQRQPNIERAERLLGWSPTIPLAEGLKKTVAYFVENLRFTQIVSYPTTPKVRRLSSNQ